MPSPRLSVVIPARNAAATLGAQLGALAATGFDDMEVIVVDNGSTDDTAELARVWTSRLDVRVLYAGQRANVGYARNVGIADAGADRIAICDADEVAGSWASAMHRALAEHSYVTGPLLLDRLNDLSTIYARGPRFDESIPLLFDVVPFATGCNVGLRRSLVERIGWFREDMVCGDDIELGLRAFEHGTPCQFVPDAAIHYRLRSESSALFRQGISYGTARPWLRRRCPTLVDSRQERIATARRLLWLARRLPLIYRRPDRTRWLWTLALVLGEIRGLVKMRSVPSSYDPLDILGAAARSSHPVDARPRKDATAMDVPDEQRLLATVATLYRERPPFFPGNWALTRDVCSWMAGELGGAARTLETGSGYSTVIFAASAAQHTCISPSQDEHRKISDWCATHGVEIDNVTFIASRSQDVLPTLELQSLDLVLIDGWHAFPVPILDWYHTAPALRVGGIMILDDDNIRPVRILHDFLRAEEDRWELVTRIGHTSAFRKLAPEVVDTGEWSTQPFSARKLLTPRERVRKMAFNLRAKVLPRSRA